jgi:predicted nucleic acid-binding protein
MFLIDTNVISELRKVKPHGGLLAWWRLQEDDSFRIPVLALYEIQAGAEITRQQDELKALEIEAWLTAIRSSYKVVDLDADSACLAAKLMHRQPPELTEDAMIAAIARTKGYTVVTRNVKDFSRFKVPYFNPFQYKG